MSATLARTPPPAPARGLDPASTPAAQGPLPSRLVALAYFIGLFAGCLFLYTRHDDFPSYYHEDEQTKAEQVLRSDRNFNHPQLLLEASLLATKVMHTPPELEPMVRVGRYTSAALAAAGVVAMALATSRAYGPGGAALAGLAVGLCPALLVFSHYMKEDASLVLGFGLAALAAQVAWARRGRRIDLLSLLLCGVACGVAAAGKYTGLFVLVVLPPFAAIWGRPGWRAGSLRTVLILAIAAASFLLINHRLLGNWHRAWDSFGHQRAQQANGLWGMRLGTPNLYHPMTFVRQCMPHVLLLAGAFAVLTLARARRSGWELFLLVLGAGYFALVSFASVPFTRYMLPAVVLAHWAAALAVLAAAARLRRGGRPRAAGAVVAAGSLLVAATQLPRCLDYSAQFAGDSRERIRAWVVRNLPEDAVFVQDGYAALGEPFDPRSGRSDRPEIRIDGSRRYGGTESAADAGDLDALRQMGVDYAVVADTEYNWFLDPTVTPAPEARAWYEKHHRWYQQLFREGRLVYRDAPRHPTWSQYNNPEVRVYRLQPD